MSITVRSKISLVECVVGVFAFDNKTKDIEAVFFPKKIEKIVEAIWRRRKGEVLDEVINLVLKLKNRGYLHFVFESDDLAKAVKEKFNLEVSVEKTTEAGEYLRNNLTQLVIKRHFVQNSDEFYMLIHDVFTELVKISIKEYSGQRDLIVSQTALLLDDIDKTLNLFANRLREWYGYHFPELSRLVDKSETYIQLVASLGERNNFTIDNLNELGLSPLTAETLSAAIKASMGTEMTERDIEEVRRFATILQELNALRGRTEQYLDDLMREVAPNTRELVGSTLGGRLIAAAGGLANLAKKSSGTIQILGAEKALFRSLKTGSRPPKHGLIFQQKTLHQSSKRQRGKIARALAGKLAIASRLDAYGGAYRGDELREKFDKRVDEIKAKNFEPLKKGTR